MHPSNQISPCSNDWYTLSSFFDDQNCVATQASPGLLAYPKRSDWHVPSSVFNEICMQGQDAPKSEPTVLTNYDVLFAFAFAPHFSSPSPDHKDSEYTLINHVGNRRFLVLINIYRPRYIAAYEQDDQVECMRIVLEIIKTIRQQCEPNGRFLQQDANSNQWLEIDEVAILVRIVEGELTKHFHSSEDGERTLKRARTSTVTLALENFFEPFYQEVAKKKFSRDGSRVSKPKPFDVICNSKWLSLQENANHVGNNRLQVILDMRFKSFESSSHKDRNIIVQDIVSAIIDDSSSQFLSLHVGSGTYMPLSRETAAICIKNALDSKLPTTATDVQKTFSSEANQLVSRYHKKRFLGEVERRNNSVHKLPMSPLFFVPRAA